MMYRTTSYAEGAFDVFWYEKNLQGDIVAVYNSSGIKLVTYDYYDAWGNYTVSYSNSGASTGVQYNPFRYRGYYYDTDLGMYYLQSRYYDAKICRFISADGYVSTGQGLLGNNMFAYCNNNPVNNVDPTGDSFVGFLLTTVVIIAVFTLLTTVGEQIAYKNAEETYEKYKDIIVIEEGVVKKSSEVSFWDIWELSAYVRYYTDSGAEGTSYGLAIEWACHNVLSNVPMFEEQAKTLNFGKTIISDFENHNTIPEIGLPILMSVIEAVTNPIFFIYDIVRSF